MLKYKIPQIVTLIRFFIRTAGFKKKENADYLFDNQRFWGEPLARLELATYALRMRCSTN